MQSAPKESWESDGRSETPILLRAVQMERERFRFGTVISGDRAFVLSKLAPWANVCIRRLKGVVG